MGRHLDICIHIARHVARHVARCVCTCAEVRAHAQRCAGRGVCTRAQRCVYVYTHICVYVYIRVHTESKVSEKDIKFMKVGESR